MCSRSGCSCVSPEPSSASSVCVIVTATGLRRTQLNSSSSGTSLLRTWLAQQTPDQHTAAEIRVQVTGWGDNGGGRNIEEPPVGGWHSLYPGIALFLSVSVSLCVSVFACLSVSLSPLSLSLPPSVCLSLSLRLSLPPLPSLSLCPPPPSHPLSLSITQVVSYGYGGFGWAGSNTDDFMIRTSATVACLLGNCQPGCFHRSDWIHRGLPCTDPTRVCSCASLLLAVGL